MFYFLPRRRTFHGDQKSVVAYDDDEAHSRETTVGHGILEFAPVAA